VSEAVETKKVLVCDDDEVFVDILEKVLNLSGFSVATANDGFQCLEKLGEFKPDILLLDIGLSNGSNGLQFMETLGKHPELAPPLIIVISGYQDEFSIARARALGAKKFFVKPINCRQLVDEINKLLGVEKVNDGAP
jgi:CheY-like chemotaxis protein